MPNMNGEGPSGRGAGTGWGRGPCGGGLKSGLVGCARGRRRFIAPENELSALEDEEKMLLEELEIIKAEKQALKIQK